MATLNDPLDFKTVTNLFLYGTVDNPINYSDRIWVGLPGDPTRPTMTFNCSKNGLRPILTIYDQIAPMK